MFTYINGARYQAFGLPIDGAVIDRIEVLKGAGGMNFGQGDPGGTLSILTKRPLREARHEIEATVGSFDYYRLAIDSSGPLLFRDALAASLDPQGGKKTVAPLSERDPVLLYRLNAAYLNAESYRDYVTNERYVIAPALTWHITPDTTLHVEFSYLHEEYTHDRGLPPHPISLRLPRERFVGEPDMPGSFSEVSSLFWQLEHRFSDDWKLRHNAGFIHQFGRSYEIAANTAIDESGRHFTRDYYIGWEDNTYLTLQLELHGAFDTGPVKHKTMLGAEFSYSEFGYAFSDSLPGTDIDLVRPSYRGFSYAGQLSSTFPPEAYGDEAYALYWDHQAALLPNLKLMLGSRFDWSEGYYKNLDNGHNYANANSTGWSPRVGIVWSPWPATDVFVSYARTFRPNLFADGNGETYEPETGEGWEAGFRQRFLADRLQLSGAVFQITKENILNDDPSDPTGRRQILNGEERSRGFELELKGSPVPGWDLTMSYGYLDAEIRESFAYPVGQDLVDVPEHQFSLFTRYQVQAGPLRGCFAGYGLYYVGERLASPDSPDLRLPSYWRHDAVVGYERDRLRVQVAVENLTSEDYFETHGYFLYPQAGLNVKASLSYKF